MGNVVFLKIADLLVEESSSLQHVSKKTARRYVRLKRDMHRWNKKGPVDIDVYSGNLEDELRKELVLSLRKDSVEEEMTAVKRRGRKSIVSCLPIIQKNIGHLGEVDKRRYLARLSFLAEFSQPQRVRQLVDVFEKDFGGLKGLVQLGPEDKLQDKVDAMLQNLSPKSQLVVRFLYGIGGQDISAESILEEVVSGQARMLVMHERGNDVPTLQEEIITLGAEGLRAKEESLRSRLVKSLSSQKAERLEALSDLDLFLLFVGRGLRGYPLNFKQVGELFNFPEDRIKHINSSAISKLQEQFNKSPPSSP